MPYASMEDVNLALKGIKPPITLAQANMIADWADKIEDVESPWAVAIANFKKAYKVEDGRWVKRVEEVDMELSEAVTKSVSGKNLPVSSFLVVGDAEEVGTWALPVKDAAGNADHRRMGGAWAALHGGYRGKKYEGPGKTKAISKLKALYKAEDMPIPGTAELGEYDGEDVEQKAQWDAPMSALSFADVDVAVGAQEAMDRLRARMGQFNKLMDNIMWSQDVKDKASALRALTEEFVALLPGSVKPTAEQGIDICVCLECGAEVEHERGSPCSKIECSECGAMMAPKTEEKAQEMETELQTVKLAETYAGVELLTVGISEGADGGPLTMKVRPIRPGFGNKKDNHYYPAEMLKRDAHLLVGVKMYESDHKDDKSTKTWVSTTTELLGFDDIGAPICEAVVHNPDFAQRVRNLDEAKLLHKLECSILGDGRVNPDQMREGRKANIVEALTVITGLDWVTRAGAGGQALPLSESEEDMEDKKDVKLDEGAPTEKPKEEAPTEAPPEEKPLDEQAVAGILAETNLPESAKTYLAETEYENEGSLKEAVTKHIEYLKAVTGSGKPFGHEGGTEVTMSDEDYDKRYDGIMESHGVRRFGN